MLEFKLNPVEPKNYSNLSNSTHLCRHNEQLFYKPDIDKTNIVKHSLVEMILDAYSNHHNIMIRPDDVWLTIMIQFSYYVNGHSEELRDIFVDHEGKKELNIAIPDYNFSRMPELFKKEIKKNVKNPELADWMDPKFSTTTEADRITCAIVLMGCHKEYFNYSGKCGCGIPKVTIKGSLTDWINMRDKLNKLLEFNLDNNYMVTWHKMLVPIINNFIKCYDKPDLNWWSKILYGHCQVSECLSSMGEGYRPSSITGWITGLCLFSNKGFYLNGNYKLNSSTEGFIVTKPKISKNNKEFFGDDNNKFMRVPKDERTPQMQEYYKFLDEHPYYFELDKRNIPKSYVEVDVNIVNLGTGKKHKCNFYGGLFLSRVVGKNTLKAQPHWHINECK